MKETGLMFKAPLVRAILSGQKTQTRRVCKPAQAHNLSYVVEVPDPKERGQLYNGSHFGDEEGEVQFPSPYCHSDRIYVRETWADLIAVSPSTDEPMAIGPGERLIEAPTSWTDGFCSEAHCDEFRAAQAKQGGA